MAAGTGHIEYVGTNGGAGKYIRIKHLNGYKTSYSHLSSYASGMQKNVRVKQGQTIGYVGESIQRGERGMDTTWMPYMWPIKTCLLIGIIFLLIQGISELFKSYWAAKKGEWPGESK